MTETITNKLEIFLYAFNKSVDQIIVKYYELLRYIFSPFPLFFFWFWFHNENYSSIFNMYKSTHKYLFVCMHPMCQPIAHSIIVVFGICSCIECLCVYICFGPCVLVYDEFLPSFSCEWMCMYVCVYFCSFFRFGMFLVFNICVYGVLCVLYMRFFYQFFNELSEYSESFDVHLLYNLCNAPTATKRKIKTKNNK